MKKLAVCGKPVASNNNRPCKLRKGHQGKCRSVLPGGTGGQQKASVGGGSGAATVDVASLGSFPATTPSVAQDDRKLFFDADVAQKAADRVEDQLFKTHSLPIETLAKYPPTEVSIMIHDEKHKKAVEVVKAWGEAVIRDGGYNLATIDDEGNLEFDEEVEYPNAPFAVVKYGGTFKDDDESDPWVDIRADLFTRKTGDTSDDWQMAQCGEIFIGVGTKRRMMYADVLMDKEFQSEVSSVSA